MTGDKRKKWYWIGGITIVSILVITFIIFLFMKKNYYEKELKTKDMEIQRLLEVVQEKETIVERKKDEISELYKAIAEKNARIKKLKKLASEKEQAMREIPLPQTVEETVKKLKEHGLTPEVRCE